MTTGDPASHFIAIYRVSSIRRSNRSNRRHGEWNEVAPCYDHRLCISRSKRKKPEPGSPIGLVGSGRERTMTGSRFVSTPGCCWPSSQIAKWTPVYRGQSSDIERHPDTHRLFMDSSPPSESNDCYSSTKLVLITDTIEPIEDSKQSDDRRGAIPLRTAFSSRCPTNTFWHRIYL